MRLGLGARLLPVVLVVALVAALGAAPAGSAVPTAAGSAESHRAGGLVHRLERIGIVASVREVPRLAPRGARFFRISFRLPVDHDRPDGRRFRLRATLVHRGVDRPTVVGTSGYGLWSWRTSYPYELTRIVRGNQLDLEHRFFKPSRPTDPDWDSQLTIRQAAADQHRIIRALQRIYDRPWLSTGHSKGGMTMTYHRRFYPGDVAGTVAYVAPDDAVDQEDVYDEFQAGVGGPAYAECRADLVAVQRRILHNRAWFRERLADADPDRPLHFTTVGGRDRALEIAVVELYFAFWQYQPAAAACAGVPGTDASRRDVWEWVDGVVRWASASDELTAPYVPYYFQAATQLGAPAPYEDEIADLLRYPGHDVAATFVPERLDPLTFDAAAMSDVDAWVRTSASQMLFVYGQLDPWSAEPFDCGADGADRQCSRLVVPGGNHAAHIGSLPPDARRDAIAQVRQWAGLDTGRAAVAAAVRRSQGPDPVLEPPSSVPAG